VLDGIAAGYTQQSAPDRVFQVPQSLPEYRPRHARLDARVRVGPSARRHRERTPAGASVRIPRGTIRNEKGDLFGRPWPDGLGGSSAPPAARLRAATSRGFGTASTVRSRTKFGSANRAWCVAPL